MDSPPMSPHSHTANALLGTNSIHSDSTLSGMPRTIHGLRRPKRVRQRSEAMPMAGSVTTSVRRDTAMSVPTTASDNPRLCE
ncbi:MAG: hypothetical protein P8Y69_12005 [Gammaproteobacteria bacterium]